MASSGPTFGGTETFDRAQYREKLWTITDAELIEEGKWIREICHQRTLPWSPSWDMKLEDCILEWRRRHPKRA